ncbi:hypothetical protein K488DRAFT_58171 [Vararia minispora EC-137]|uniref:Uncharacterized protein n=1 Tax=Vararia minispora EC-137 TaxID=1314806 RepID=A0ACB8QAA8_9AGAM|nr:hypothetical protein K488DRAFT_58171 [Vararia minispora EC-137]
MSSISSLPPLQPLAIDPASLSSIQHSQLPNGQPGPSSAVQSTSAFSSAPRRSTPAPKRRRTDSSEPADASPAAASSPAGQKKDSQKKKKASRACALCQKAHLTCDDSRPCQRCIKRGVGDQCVEGHRKRAKYLLDEEELASAVFSPSDPLFSAFTYDPGLFGSEAAGLEYSYLSQMLGKTSPDSAHDHTNSPPSVPPSSATAEFPSSWPADVFAPGARGDEVYAAVTKPYDYTEGYHFLMKNLPHRFEKNDILRIVRALAIFRPSLIALQMPLTEEDEVFVEKSLQRSIIELNKLISYVGTPTVVWRRTGEICLVGPEFCMLTDWSKEELLGKRKYIWELFENQSVVEYWENFATHAFENTTQSVYSHCVLLKPDGTPVPATFCFHIRRDIFDLPSLVIGQWLPLL